MTIYRILLLSLSILGLQACKTVEYHFIPEYTHARKPVTQLNLANIDSFDIYSHLTPEYFPNLSVLRLTSCDLHTLPPHLLEFKKLVMLDLFSNKINPFPAEIVKLKKLRYLGLADNGLTSLPEKITELKHLRTLDISWNPMTELPKEVLKLSNLVTLAISSTKITTLPKEMKNLKKLTKVEYYRHELSYEQLKAMEAVLPEGCILELES